ncbi:MAG: capsule biosynthesis protein [Amylibacter sp.]|nr:capsule biosynthesis protein [Amylibacter sp.]
MPNNEKKSHIAHGTDADIPTHSNGPGAISSAANDPAHSDHSMDAGTQMSARDEINLIKQENLTGRQLRMARRLAQKHGLQTTSDLDAVRVLRNKGTDPFQSSNNMLKTAAGLGGAQSNLPATVRRSDLAQARPLDEVDRQIEIKNIQKDLVKRRRRRIAALVTKLICFIAIPTILAGYYFIRVATPMYASFTEFVIQKSDNPNLGAGASLFSGSILDSVQDSVSVQGYLSSRDAMLRLDKDLGFTQAFQGEKIDALQRVDSDATNEAAYRNYKKRVRIGFDPTEGVIKMEVVTPDPEQSYAFSRALINYAEQKVDLLTERLRKDQMKGADVGYQNAELKYAEAQDRVVELQEALGVMAPNGEITAQMALIQQIESDIQIRRLELVEMLDNPRPNTTKVTILKKSIESRKNLVTELRDEMTIGSNGELSLAKITAELQSAQSQLIMRRELLGASLLRLETSRVEATRQTRYLSMSVTPVKPDEATYPKAFENTLLAFVVFAGLFLMVSLTASILREQVTT